MCSTHIIFHRWCNTTGTVINSGYDRLNMFYHGVTGEKMHGYLEIFHLDFQTFRKITSREKNMAKVQPLDQGKKPSIASLSARLGALQVWCEKSTVNRCPDNNDGQTSCRNSGRRKIIHYSLNWRGMFSGYSWTKPSSFWRGRQFSGDKITLGYLVREDQQGQTKGTLLLRLSAVRKKVAATLCKLQIHEE